MKGQANMAPNSATELMIADLFDEVGTMAYVLKREYEAWALGHRTDKELANTEHQWAMAIQALNDNFEAEIRAHIRARRETRARYLAEQEAERPKGPVERACDRCGATRPYGKRMPTFFLNVGIAPEANYYLCPACRADIRSLLLDRGDTQPSGPPPESLQFNGTFIRRATAEDDRSTWPLQALLDCGCDACKAELQRRSVQGPSTFTIDAPMVPSSFDDFRDAINQLAGTVFKVVGIPDDLVHGPQPTTGQVLGGDVITHTFNPQDGTHTVQRDPIVICDLSEVDPPESTDDQVNP